LLVTAGVAQAKVDADRIGKLVGKDKLEKASDLCLKRLDEGAIDDPALVAACGDARLRHLTADPATPPAPEVLRALCENWAGSPAAGEAWELLARMLVDGTEDPAVLDELSREFSGTAGGDDAARRVWEAVAATRGLGKVQQWLAGHPDSPHLEAAKALEAELAWERAETADTVAAWRELMDGWPAHPRRAGAAVALREARFREVVDGTPAEMVTLAQEYPDDDRSVELIQRAWVGAVQVVAVLEEGEPEGLTCSFDRAQQPTILGGALRAVQVAGVEGFEPAVAEVELLRDGNLSSVSTLEFDLAAAGLPGDLVDGLTMLPAGYVGREGGGEFDVPGWVCRPPEPEVWSVVRVETPGGDLLCPFRPARSCDEAAAGLVERVPLKMRGKELILGGFTSEAREIVPDLEPKYSAKYLEQLSGPKRRPEDVLCDDGGLCMHFLHDRLYKVEDRCEERYEEEGTIDPEVMDLLTEWERQTPRELGVREVPYNQDKTVWRAGEGLFVARSTVWDAFGRHESAWVAHHGLLCAAVALGREHLREDVPLTCP